VNISATGVVEGSVTEKDNGTVNNNGGIVTGNINQS
jgi:hypothetical protein